MQTQIIYGIFVPLSIAPNLWCCYPVSSIYRLRVAYNNAYRIQVLFNLPSRIHNNETMVNNGQRWSRGHKARDQGQGHKKKSEAKDSLSEDRHSRGQGQECSRPRTQAQVLSKKKRSSQKLFKRSPRKNVFHKIFQVFHKILTIQKIGLSSSRGQANFRGLEASKPRPKT